MDHPDRHESDLPNAAQMKSWVVAANVWGEATQALVGAAAGLTLASRTLAETIESSEAARSEPSDPRRQALHEGLRVLGDEVENESQVLRDRFLSTAANLAEYREILG
jgi:hypothetical protein